MTIIELFHNRFTKSPSWKRLAESSKRTHRKAIKEIAKHLEDDIEYITRTDIIHMRDDLSDRPGVANNCLSLTSILMNFAVDYGYLEESEYSKISKLPVEGYKPWSREDVNRIDKIENGSARRTVLMCLYTGQRLCDVATIKWSDIRGRYESIELVQMKTRQLVYLPLPDRMQQYLRFWDTLPHKEHDFICTMSDKVSLNGLRERVRYHIRKVGIEGTIHGLRYTSLSRFAEAGCSDREIMAISGHRTVRMVSKYTKYVNQKSMAESAIRRLNNAEGQGRQEDQGSQ